MNIVKAFEKIGLMSHLGKDDVAVVYEWLQKHRPDDLVLEQALGERLGETRVAELNELGQQCNLVIAVGGDGTMMDACRALAGSGAALLGINLGRIGFLTDTMPHQLDSHLMPMLDGEYREEYRNMLQFMLNDNSERMGVALNEMVLHSGKAAHLIEIQIAVGEHIPYQVYADGVIVATPTGSTAYALSAGGPIVDTSLSALVVLPMLPQNIASRPLVVAGNQDIVLSIISDTAGKSELALDGQVSLDIGRDDRVRIASLPKQLRLIHPMEYDSFRVYQSKLGWKG